MRRKLLLLLAIVVVLAVVVAAPVSAKAPLRATTTYDFLANDGFVRGFPDNPQILAWQGPITGDISGCIEWWSDLDPPMIITGQASHYSLTVEVHEGACPEGDPAPAEGEVILAADGSGTTTDRHMKNSNWRTNSTVTIAEGDYASWLGRNVHESGHFEWDDDDPPNPLKGTSDFRIN